MKTKRVTSLGVCDFDHLNLQKLYNWADVSFFLSGIFHIKLFSKLNKFTFVLLTFKFLINFFLILRVFF